MHLRLVLWHACLRIVDLGGRWSLWRLKIWHFTIFVSFSHTESTRPFQWWNIRDQDRQTMLLLSQMIISWLLVAVQTSTLVIISCKEAKTRHVFSEVWSVNHHKPVEVVRLVWISAHISRKCRFTGSFVRKTSPPAHSMIPANAATEQQIAWCIRSR